MAKETSITFRDFFQERFFNTDRKYVDISMSRILAEMAVPMDIAKFPVKPDADDIQYLQQFPSQYWLQAMHQRYYHDLKDALADREARRGPTEKRLYELIRKAMHTGNYAPLRGQVSEEIMTRLQNGDYDHVQGDDELTDKAARHWAELETEKAVPHGTDPKRAEDEGVPPGYRRYTFKVSRNTNQTVTYVAKPYINRLIHKLERTRGTEHHPESGLQSLGMTHGQYGYDLYGLKQGNDEDPHTTRGMQLPPRAEVSARMADFLGHNSHSMYGKLPEGPDIVYKPVGEGRTMYRDKWTVAKMQKKVFSRMVSQLTTAEPGSYQLPDGTRVPPEGGFEKESDRRKAAAALTQQELIRMAEAGELVGPVVPGINNGKGLPVKVVGEGAKKKLVPPPMYLPHKKMQIRVQDSPDSPPRMVTHEVPMVNPAEYLRELGSEEDDDNIDASTIRGHAGDYVSVPHNDWVKSRGYLAGGALHLTHNSQGRQHMDPSDPEYDERKKEIEEGMGFVGLDDQGKANAKGEGQYFGDIIKGIWNCINSACGGMTAHETAIMKQNVPDLHTMVYQKMMMNLRDHKMETPAGRRAFARNTVSSWAQQDLGQGGGTRRLRKLKQTGRNASMDATADGESGDQLSLRDSIQMQMRDKETAAGDPTKLSRGQKARPGAGQHAFPYNLDNFRATLAEMEGEAATADTKRDRAVAMSKSDISDEIADLIGDAIADKAAVMIKMEYLLGQLFMGSGEADPEEAARARVAQYSAGGRATAKNIVAAFKADKRVQELLNAPEAGGDDELQKDAIEKLHGVLGRLPQDKLQDPTTQGMIYNFIKTQMPPEFEAVLRAEADKAFGKPAAAPTPAAPQPTAAAPAAKSPGRAAVDQMIAAKNWIGLSNNSYFLQNAPVGHLQAVIGKLEGEMQTKQGVEREDHDLAIAHLRSLLKRKQSNEFGEIK